MTPVDVSALVSNDSGGRLAACSVSNDNDLRAFSQVGLGSAAGDQDQRPVADARIHYLSRAGVESQAPKARQSRGPASALCPGASAYCKARLPGARSTIPSVFVSQ